MNSFKEDLHLATQLNTHVPEKALADTIKKTTCISK